MLTSSSSWPANLVPMVVAHSLPLNEGFFFFAWLAAAWCLRFPGYYLFARGLERHWPDVVFNPVALAFARGFAGFIVASAYWRLVVPRDKYDEVDASLAVGMILYAGLFLIRFGEWLLVLWLFLARHVPRATSSRLLADCFRGLVCSLLLDFAMCVVAIPLGIAAMFLG